MPTIIDLSIIIPHDNSLETLEKLLNSIPKVGNIEVIVIDDCSTKNSDLFSREEYKYIVFTKTPKNSGAGAARNIGMEKATGKYVLFADADDYFLEGFLDIVLPYTQSDLDCIFFKATSIYINTSKTANRHIGQNRVIGSYILYKDLRENLDFKKNPLCIAIVLIAISLFLPSFFSSIGAVDALRKSCVQIVPYIFLILFFQEIKKEKDIRFFILGLAIILAIAVVYGFFERLNDFENPLINYEISLNPNFDEGVWSYNSEGLRGGRVRSIFAHAIGSGGTMAAAFCFFIYSIGNRQSFWKQNPLFKISLLFGIILICFFSNSRSPLIFLGIPLLFLLNSKIILYSLLLVPVLLLISWDTIAQYFVNVQSLFSSSTQEDVGGSNFEMRILQIIVTFSIWQNNPIFGDGAGATNHWIEQNIGLLGAESVWFKLLINSGIFGCFVYLFLLKSLLKLGIGKAKKYVWGSVFGWLIFETVTSTPGMHISFLIMLLIIAFKIESIKLAVEVRA